MAKQNTDAPDLETIEIKEKRRELRESAVAPWQYLVRRHHPW